MSDSPYAHYGTPDPEYAALFAQMPALDSSFEPEVGRKGYADFVKILKSQQKDGLPDASRYKTVDHSVPVANGTASIVVRTITPSTAGPFPVYYYIHGGGFIMGTIDLAEGQFVTQAVELDMAVALVDYRLAPENPHPACINDVMDGLRWLISNTSTLNIDISKGFVIGGESAGACLAAVAAHIIRDEPFFAGKQPTGQMLQIPCTVDPRGYPEQHKAELRSLYMDTKMTGLTEEFVRDMYARYLNSAPTDPTASPLLFSLHANLPPAFVQIAGLDLLRDEGLLYEKVLREAGVETKLIVYPGVPHGFHIMYAQLSATKKWDTEFREGLRSFLKL